MNILFHLGHPAHFHLFKNVISKLSSNGHTIAILIKKKDVLEDLLQASGLKYHNILPLGRRDTKLGIAMGMLESDYKILIFSLKFKPDLLIGTSYAISHIGKLLGIPSLNVNEDDAKVVPLYSKLSYPWATHILSPVVCDNDKWKHKTIFYEGYHELAYLHPDNFSPSIDILKNYIPNEKPFFLVRFAKLNAHHDKGIFGINDTLANKIIDLLKPYGSIYITSERKLASEFEPYRLKVPPLELHHIMAYASIYIGDSQTMAAESGVLGVPFIRFNDFVGRIGYLKELEEKYCLGFGIKSDQPELLLETLKKLLSMKDRAEVFASRRTIMLKDKINVAEFFSWLIENYPDSVGQYRMQPNIQFRFR